MHSVYNYTGFIDIAAEVMKLKSTEAGKNTDDCTAEGTSTAVDKPPRAGSEKSERG